MGLLNDLLKPKGRQPATVAEADAALAKLNAERDAANEKAKAATRRRGELLLVDGSETKIAEAEAEADACRLTIERLDAAEPLLLRRLAELRDAARQRLRLKLLDDHEQLTAPYVEAHRAAVAAAVRLLTAKAELEREGFRAEAVALPTPPPYLLDMARAGAGIASAIVHPGVDAFETESARAHRALRGDR